LSEGVCGTEHAGENRKHQVQSFHISSIEGGASVANIVDAGRTISPMTVGKSFIVFIFSCG
jgi:hypothetical protein